MDKNILYRHLKSTFYVWIFLCMSKRLFSISVIQTGWIWMHCVQAIKHFWKGIASIILWLQVTREKTMKKNIIKFINDVIIKCVHLYLILAVNRTIHQSNLENLIRSKLTFCPRFSNAAKQHESFSSLWTYKYAFQITLKRREKKICIHKKATRVLLLIFFAFGNI